MVLLEKLFSNGPRRGRHAFCPLATCLSPYFSQLGCAVVQETLLPSWDPELQNVKDDGAGDGAWVLDTVGAAMLLTDRPSVAHGV